MWIAAKVSNFWMLFCCSNSSLSLSTSFCYFLGQNKSKVGGAREVNPMMVESHYVNVGFPKLQGIPIPIFFVVGNLFMNESNAACSCGDSYNLDRRSQSII